MKYNMGKADKTIRILAGVTILAAGVISGSWWGLVGLIPLATAMIGWCPLYAPFGISTIGKAKSAAAGSETEDNRRKAA